EAVSLAIATAVGESALLALTISDWSNPGAHALLFAFLAGPPLFLALLVWRRRDHARRSRALFVVAILLAVGGLGALGYNLYRFNTDAEFRKTPNMLGLIVPLVQWGIIMAIWLCLVVQEGLEKRAARQAGQATHATQTGSETNATKPPQSA